MTCDAATHMTITSECSPRSLTLDCHPSSHTRRASAGWFAGGRQIQHSATMVLQHRATMMSTRLSTNLLGLWLLVVTAIARAAPRHQYILEPAVAVTGADAFIRDSNLLHVHALPLPEHAKGRVMAFEYGKVLPMWYNQPPCPSASYLPFT